MEGASAGSRSSMGKIAYGIFFNSRHIMAS